MQVHAEFREALNEYRSDYDIGGTGRYYPTPKGVQAQGSGADYHYANETQFFRAIERARHFDRNNMVVGQGVNRLAANLVQDGFTLNVGTKDKGADQALKDRWYEWSEDPEACDYEGEKTFYQMEVLAARTVPVDGDIFCLPLEQGSLQWMEAHRCRRPASMRRNTCLHGVNLDSDTARRKSYFFTREDVDPLGRVKTLKDVIEVQARGDDGEKQVLHVYWPQRFSQRRGVTAFAPVGLPIQYHDDIQFANLVATQVQSCFAILEQQLAGMNVPPPARTGNEAQTGARTTEALEDGTTRTQEGMAPGMRVRAKEGWGLTGFAPTIPGPRYIEHSLMILTIIAINLDLPVHVLLLDPSRTNFSGWRGAIEQARIRFRVMQRLLINQFYSPVYRWKVRQWMTEDRGLQSVFEKHGNAIFGHTWNPPTWQYIEPLKDIQANTLEAASSGTSRRRQAARRGDDWDELVPEIAEDNGKLIEAAYLKADALNKQYPELKLTWRDVISLPMPDGVTVQISPETEKPAPKVETAA